MDRNCMLVEGDDHNEVGHHRGDGDNHKVVHQVVGHRMSVRGKSLVDKNLVVDMMVDGKDGNYGKDEKDE